MLKPERTLRVFEGIPTAGEHIVVCTGPAKSRLKDYSHRREAR